MMNPFPLKPVLVFVAVIAAVRLSLSFPVEPFLSPSLLASSLFLYAPLPRYWRRGFPAWVRATDPGGSVAVFALLVPASIYLALQVGQDNSLDRLVVHTDPTFEAAEGFAEVFGATEYVVLLAEAPDPDDLVF